MKVKFVLTLFAILFIISCAYLKDAGWKGYVAATDELATLAESYQSSYEMASPEAQIKWKRDIDPLFIEADKILNDWKFALQMGSDPTQVQKSFLAIRMLILKSLIEVEKGK